MATSARELSAAISAHRIVPYYQPQVDARTGAVVAAEALSRWTVTGADPIPPSEFVALAESTGDIHELGVQVLRDACAAAAGWASDGIPLDISVNVSPLQLEDDRFFDAVDRELAASAPPPERLTLEVTESRELSSSPRLRERLGALRARGIVVSVDDFPTGFSSLDRVALLAAGELKLDRSELSRHPDTAVRASVETAHRLGLRVVAEGVETPAELAFAREIGCDRIQGYLIARPAAPDVFRRWLRERRGR